MLHSKGRESQSDAMRRYLLLATVLLFFISFQNVFAQSAQVQPILGFAWPTHNIPVSIVAPPSNVKQAVLNAMRTWNLAQQWFITAYVAGQGAPFVLYETNMTFDSMITVSFNQTQTIDYLGWTKSYESHDYEGNFKTVTVNITIDLTKHDGELLTDIELQRLATHELGHALGLDHTTFSPNDLMNPIPRVVFPSTLNLYAVHLLSETANMKRIPQKPVSLPSLIPYTVVSQTDLDMVVAPVVEIRQTTVAPLGTSQLVYNLTYGPWLWVGLLVALAGVVVASTTHQRKLGSVHWEEETAEHQLIVHEKPMIAEAITPPKNVKTCRYCKAKVPQQYFICPACGMPAGYL